ncbi:GumC family protein [Parathalassolituus penaei]|uniref:non-specific protein-tyrosine kinase n=1 Tax=Parathalassolituus penaei TaxID=2997323 RepID=A0A9X3EM96_9GAMM|nr:polysaccharide biosynthesis tyrosine autokinase [Parathalassolituus penaei]MCY0966961.1 polysaccharide biosynthesis tyrosine autokinase [Parathalassolituus penaei]
MKDRTMAMNGPAAEEVIDLTHYWRVFRRHLGRIVTLGIVATVLAVLGVMAVTPVYRATSTLLIESQDSKILSIEEVYGLPSASDEYYQTQFEILKSRELAKRVAMELDLVKNPEFNPHHEANKQKFSFKRFVKEKLGLEEAAATEDQILVDTIDAFWKVVSVEPIRNTQLVKISVDSESPELAAQAANAIAQAYINSQLEARVGMSQQAATWLSDRLGGLKEKLNASERKLQEYREAHNLVDVEGVDTLISKQIDEITRSLVEASAKRLEAESTYQQLKSVGKRTYENLGSLSFIMGNPVIVGLRQDETKAELKVSELSKRYGAQHPKMIAAQSELSAVRDGMLAQMNRIAAAIEKDFNTARDKEVSLQKVLDNKLAEARNLNRTEFTLNDYVREVKANRELYDAFFSRIRETTETGDLQSANARISDPAVVPKVPVKPNKKLIVVLTMVVSLMFGVGVAFLLDALDATLKNADDVDRKLGVPLLGVVPMVESEKSDGKLSQAQEDARLVRAFTEDTVHGFTESVRTLRTSLTLAGLESPAQVILFTSSIPGEGKTTTSTNIAEAYGQMEKTLLIDADMRRPTMAKKLGLPHNSRGLSNAVAYPDTLDECIHQIPDLGIDVIPSGPIPPNPLELLGSRNFRELLDTLRGRYQRIIIDSAPMRLVSDALYLSTLVDGVVYIVKADATRDKLVKSSLVKLDESNVRVLGVVLNQLDVHKEAKYGYGYGYYGGYYDAYGYTSDKQDKA